MNGRIGLIAAFVAASCSSTKVDEDPLPFNVAVIPVTKSDRKAVAALEASAEENQDESEGFRLLLDEDQLGKAILRELRARGFARVSVLEAGDAEELATANEPERGRYWQELARTKHHADLLVRPELFLSDRLEGGINDRFYLNLVLFALGGPFCWWVSDRTYEANARLAVRFYDISREQTDVWQEELLPFSIQATFDGTSLRFIDRADGVGQYALSIICPAGFLARRTDHAEESVREAALDELSSELVDEILSNGAAFVEAREADDIALDLRRSSVQRVSESEAAVDITLSGREGLASYTILAEGTPLFSEETDAGKDQYRISRPVSIPPATTHLQILLISGQGRPRSYTFKL